MHNLGNTNILDLKGAKEINFKEHFSIISKRLWVLLIITLLATSLGIIKNTYFTTPLYESSTRIIIGADTDYMATLLVLIEDPAVLQEVINELGVKKSPEELAQQISVGSINGSQVVRINVLDTDPRMAARIANTTANIYKSKMPKIVGFSDIKLLTEAKANPNPINSDGTRTLLIAIFSGLVIGIGLIYFLYALDDTISSNDELENILGFPVIGTISKMNSKSIKNKDKKINDLEVRGESIGY
jgi:capsular polysaccharide biosynthesis protein